MHSHQTDQASLLLSCARSWLGTRFSHQGRLKKTADHRGGVDCLGLLVGIAAEMNLRGAHGNPLARFDNREYSRTPNTQQLREALEKLLTVRPPQHISAGDIGLFCIQGSPQHLGIVGESAGELTLIHAYAQARKVVEHPLDAHWRSQLVAAFSLPQP